MSERDALLEPSISSHSHSHSHTNSACHSSDEGSSCSGSDYEWEEAVLENGHIFYIDSLPLNQRNSIIPNKSSISTKESSDNNQDDRINNVPFARRDHRRNSTRTGKFARLIGRNRKKVFSSTPNSSHSTSETNPTPSSSTTPSTNENEFKDDVVVRLRVVSQNNLGRRATLSETLLGLEVLFQDNRVIISGFIPDSEIQRYRAIKIGDCLRSIDGIDVNPSNFDDTLNRARNGSITLRIQTAIPDNTPIQSPFAQTILNPAKLMTPATGVIYIDPDPDRLIFRWGSAKDILWESRGVFVTMQHLMVDVGGSKPPTVSHIDTNLGQMFIIHYADNLGRLLLVGFPETYTTNSTSANSFVSLIVNYMIFMFGSLQACLDFEEGRVTMENLFNLWMTGGPLEEGLGLESVLPCAPYTALPRGAQTLLDESMAEIEANDPEPEGLRRTFIALGSCVFHGKYLLATHVPNDTIGDIYTCLRFLGILRLVQDEGVRLLVFWHPVHLRCPPPASNHQAFLLVVAEGRLIVATILEAGGAACAAPIHSPPDPEQVERARDVLARLRELGVATLADTWLRTSPRPQVALPGCLEPTLPRTPSSPSVGASVSRHSSDSDSEDTCSECSEEAALEAACFEGVLPSRLGAGPLQLNAVLRYVQLDEFNGILLCPTAPEPSKRLIETFGLACIHLKRLLQHAIHFRATNSTNTPQRSLLAVKEHGVLLSPESWHGDQPIWVVARLFFQPHPRQVFVCFRDSAPQNLVELSFRLGLLVAG